MSNISKVLVVGVFDLLHRGHIELLRTASGYGDELYVLVNGDEFTARYKRTPIICETDRLETILSLKWVKDAEITNSPDIKPYIEKFSITHIVHGDDWEHKSYLKQICIDEDYIQRKGIRMIYTPYYRGTSTSAILDKIKSGQ